MRSGSNKLHLPLPVFTQRANHPSGEEPGKNGEQEDGSQINEKEQHALPEKSLMLGIQIVQEYGREYAAFSGQKGGGNIIILSIGSLHGKFYMARQDVPTLIRIKIQPIAFFRCFHSLPARFVYSRILFHGIEKKGLSIVVKEKIKIVGSFHLKKPLMGDGRLVFQVA